MKIDVSGFGGSEMASEDEVVTEAVAEIERQARDHHRRTPRRRNSTPAEFEDSIDTESFEPEAMVESEPSFEPEPAIEPAFEPRTGARIRTRAGARARTRAGRSDDDIGAEEPAVAETPPPVSSATPSQRPDAGDSTRARRVRDLGRRSSLTSRHRFSRCNLRLQSRKRRFPRTRRSGKRLAASLDLLVSEIKLYNEEQVERGRESSDIYQRLREDIDRSREMFEKRISAEVRERQDYFQDELVRVLADGDPDLLGM